MCNVCPPPDRSKLFYNMYITKSLHIYIYIRLHAYMTIYAHCLNFYLGIYIMLYYIVGVAKNNNYYTTTTYVFVYRVFEHFSRTYFENYLQTPKSACKWNRNWTTHVYIWVASYNTYIYMCVCICKYPLKVPSGQNPKEVFDSIRLRYIMVLYYRPGKNETIIKSMEIVINVR